MTFKVNQRRFLFRGILVLLALGIYLWDSNGFQEIISQPLFHGITPTHLLWAFLVLEMLIIPFPATNRYVSCGKHFLRHYIPSGELDDAVFLPYSRRMNKAAAAALGVWAAFMGLMAFLYYTGMIDTTKIILITLVLYLCDQVFVNIWCPFQAFILKNKCCNTCRIYNWGHFMMFSPLMFIRNFYTISLFILSLLILFQWEFLHYRYPERFSPLTNLALRCSHCKDTICKIKKQLMKTPQGTSTLPQRDEKAM